MYQQRKHVKHAHGHNRLQRNDRRNSDDSRNRFNEHCDSWRRARAAKWSDTNPNSDAGRHPDTNTHTDAQPFADAGCDS